MISSEQLKGYSYFSGLSDVAREALSCRMRPVEFMRGSEIIRQGVAAQAFYIVRRGEVEVLKKTRWGQAAKITSLKRGDGFGEMALLTCSRRNCSVVARTKVSLYEIHKSDFDEIVRLDRAFLRVMGMRARSQVQYNQLKSLQPLALMEPALMDTLKLREESYGAGSFIIKEGDVARSYYIIRSGHVAVVIRKDRQTPEQVAILGEGEGFGEESLIAGKRRNATVHALEDTVVLNIDAQDFEEFLKNSFLEWQFPEEITPEKAGERIFIDARVRSDYEHAHIENALNIPLEELRHKHVLLDPAKKYYTYCDLDARGLCAAFLLRSHGFDATGIRGGLSAWEGPVATGKSKVGILDEDD